MKEDRIPVILDRPRTKLGTNNMSNFFDQEKIPQYLAAAAVTLGGFSLGTCIGYSSPALPSLLLCEHFPFIENSHLSWVGSLLTIGALCGSALGGLSIENIGRRNTLILTGIPFTIGWLTIAFARQLSLVYIGRLMTGFGVGGISVAGPVYLSEISQPCIRGLLGAVFQVVVVVGILFAYVTGSLCTWEVLAAISSFFPIMFTVSMVFLPESPRYLLSIGKVDNALKSLALLRGADMDHPSKSLMEEVDEIEESMQRSVNERRMKTSLLGLPVLKPLMITLGLMFCNQFSGSEPIGFYTVSIFEEAGFGVDAYLSSIIVGIVQVISIILASAFVEKVGRRVLLMTSFSLMCISLAALGIFFSVKNGALSINGDCDILSWVPLPSVILYNAAYTGGAGCLVWTVMSEILPTHIIGFGFGLATTLNWSLAFVTTKFYHDFNDSFGIHNTFWLFAGCCGCACAFIFICVPETKGKTLDQIQKENFQKSGKHISTVNKITNHV